MYQLNDILALKKKQDLIGHSMIKTTTKKYFKAMKKSCTNSLVKIFVNAA